MTQPPIIVTSPEELRAIVRDAVRLELASRSGAAPAEYIDAHGVASLLGVHYRSVQKLATHQGLPSLRFGKLRRYERAAVLRWAAEQGRKVAR